MPLIITQEKDEMLKQRQQTQGIMISETHRVSTRAGEGTGGSLGLVTTLPLLLI